MRKNIEILAPAGSFESFQAAMHAGSDAVYLGGTQFSARASASNFNKEQLLKALDEAHLYGRKVYMTVNTLLKEQEIKLLPEYLLPFYQHGLDAVIVQDTGVLKTIAENFPDLALHISTQMTLTGSLGADIFTDKAYPYHVTRIVPARELSLDELRNLRKQTTLELEVFVHGALCVCYSGQCYLSSMIGGRSGNRGRCAQPCRKLYTAADTRNTAYWLSPKDLCTLEMIPDLVEAGIDSFKIEGRMKKPEYTAYISYLYRKYVDRYLTYGRKEYETYFQQHPKELEDDLRGMKDLYNRGGFTKGYFIHHNGKDMMSVKRPNHEGVRVGTIISVTGNTADVLWKEPIFAHDVLEIRDQGNAIYEYTTKDGQRADTESRIRFLSKARVTSGMNVYRTRNQTLLAWIQTNISERSVKVPICGSFKAKLEEKAELTLWKRGNQAKSITVEGAVCQRAQKQPMREETVKKQLSKLGDSDFIWDTLDIEIEAKTFLPIKSLNELRRKALSAWKTTYLQSFYRNIPDISYQTPCTKKTQPILLQIAAEVLTTAQWYAALVSPHVSIIYARMEIIEETEYVSLTKATVQCGKNCYVSFPRVLHERHIEQVCTLLNRLCSQKLCTGLLLHNIEELGFVKRWISEKEQMEASFLIQHLQLVADFSMYSTNRQAIHFWKEHGIRRITASIEQNKQELSELFAYDDGVETELQVYGRIPVMVSAQCITSYGMGKNCLKRPDTLKLTDAWKETLLCKNFCKFCYNILYSKQPCDLRFQAADIKTLSVHVLRCSFTEETEEETQQILAVWNNLTEINTFYQTKTWTGHFCKGMI